MNTQSSASSDLANVNQTVLATAIELGRDVIMEIMGDEIAASVDGQDVTSPAVCDLLAAKLHAELNLSNPTNGA